MTAESEPQIVQYDGHAWVRLGEWQKLRADLEALKLELRSVTESARNLLDLFQQIGLQPSLQRKLDELAWRHGAADLAKANP
jgi:hypothetical protein